MNTYINKNNKKMFVFSMIGLFLMILSIDFGDISVGHGGLLSFLHMDKDTAYACFFSDLLLCLIAFVLALCYMPKFKGDNCASDE